MITITFYRPTRCIALNRPRPAVILLIHRMVVNDYAVETFHDVSLPLGFPTARDTSYSNVDVQAHKYVILVSRNRRLLRVLLYFLHGLFYVYVRPRLFSFFPLCGETSVQMMPTRTVRVKPIVFAYSDIVPRASSCCYGMG